MHTFVQAASRALAQQDAEMLERLAEEVCKQTLSPFSLDLRELSGALDVLTKQVKIAETHLGLPAMPNNSNEWNTWEL
jgi:hypothetical protein